MAKIKVKKLKPMKIAYIEHTGAYDKIPYGEYFEKLYKWAKETKAKPGFKPMGIFLSDPKTTAPEAAKTWVAIPIRGTPAATDAIQIKDLPATDAAVCKYAGDSEVIEQTYKELNAWVEQNGYEVSAPPMEVYTKMPKEKDGKSIVYAVVQMPVKKK